MSETMELDQVVGKPAGRHKGAVLLETLILFRMNGGKVELMASGEGGHRLVEEGKVELGSVPLPVGVKVPARAAFLLNGAAGVRGEMQRMHELARKEGMETAKVSLVVEVGQNGEGRVGKEQIAQTSYLRVDRMDMRSKASLLQSMNETLKHCGALDVDLLAGWPDAGMRPDLLKSVLASREDLEHIRLARFMVQDESVLRRERPVVMVMEGVAVRTMMVSSSAEFEVVLPEWMGAASQLLC